MIKEKKEFEVFKLKFKEFGILNEFAIFECYGDNIFTFGYYRDHLYYQIDIICDDDLTREMLISDILELKTITFLDINVFDKNVKNTGELIYNYSLSFYENMLN
jgi:hypothetical protein